MRESELILNPDGSIYHLNVGPGDVATTIILVGDQDRVPMVSRHFDHIDLQQHKREFVTHTGRIGQKHLSVVSTGIGTDNIDIALNELDALFNIDFGTRTFKTVVTPLQFIRIGTSGSVHPDVHLEELLVSRYAIGIDSLGEFYGGIGQPHELLPPWSYLAKAHEFDLGFMSAPFKEGITVTCPGFYAAQGRTLRLNPDYKLPITRLSEIEINGFPITNMEMETAAIYLLSEKLGHKAISFNAILAHRIKNTFSKSPTKVVEKSIEDILTWIVHV